MPYILLYKGSCAACSRVAGMVSDISVAGLRTLPVESPEVQQLLRDAGLEMPDRPVLLVQSDDGVTMASGWRMRRLLASLLGWRRARAIVRLSAAEWRARWSEDTPASGLSRRGALGAGMAGVAAVVLPVLGRKAARARPAAAAQPAEPKMAVADEAEVRRALATAPVRQALETWGPIESTVREATDENGSVLVLVHTRGDVITFVDREHDRDNPTAISMQPKTDQPGMRFYTVAGTAVTDVTLSGGKVTAVAVGSDARSGSASPDSYPAAWAYCFAGCVNANVSAGCLQYCYNCALAEGAVSRFLNCLACACAGSSAVKCAVLCL